MRSTRLPCSTRLRAPASRDDTASYSSTRCPQPETTLDRTDQLHGCIYRSRRDPQVLAHNLLGLFRSEPLAGGSVQVVPMELDEGQARPENSVLSHVTETHVVE